MGRFYSQESIAHGQPKNWSPTQTLSSCRSVLLGLRSDFEYKQNISFSELLGRTRNGGELGRPVAFSVFQGVSGAKLNEKAIEGHRWLRVETVSDGLVGHFCDCSYVFVS